MEYYDVKTPRNSFDKNNLARKSKAKHGAKEKRRQLDLHTFKGQNLVESQNWGVELNQGDSKRYA